MPTKASARKQFLKSQKQLLKEYEAAGMTEYQISEMFEFDLTIYNRNLAYDRHTQPLMPEDENDDIDEGKNPLLKKFIESIAIVPNPSMSAKFWWLDEIDDENLYMNLIGLSEEELELIDLIAYQGFSQTEIAEMLDKSQSSISQRIKTIRKKLKRIQ